MANLAERLLPCAIDDQALSRPRDMFFSVPEDDNDLSQGFIDVSCAQFANAITHAVFWLNAKVLEYNIQPFDAVAYQGPNDLRYPILAVAAAKVGIQVSRLKWWTSGVRRCKRMRLLRPCRCWYRIHLLLHP
jgi:hypothetical protein